MITIEDVDDESYYLNKLNEAEAKIQRLQERLNECEEALVEAYYDCYNEGFEPDLAKEYLEKYGIEI